MKDHAERFARVARGWDEAAEGYDAYFVPRFAPWVEAAVEAVTTSEPPEGPVLVRLSSPSGHGWRRCAPRDGSLSPSGPMPPSSTGLSRS